MKMIKYFAIVALIFTGSISANAQFSLGGQTTYFKLLGDGVNAENIGIGLRGEFEFTKKITVIGSVSYVFPSTFSDRTYGYAYSNNTSPGSIDIHADYSISFVHLKGGAKIVFIGKKNPLFDIYGVLEGGLLIAPTSLKKIQNFDETLYYSDITSDPDEVYNNFTIGGGLGASVKLASFSIFAEALLNIPANDVNGNIVDVEIPISSNLNLGCLYHF